MPIRLVHDRWIDKYTERPVSALADLKAELEGTDMPTQENVSTTTQVHRVFIKAAPEAIWAAITKPEWSERYGYGGRVEYDLRPGGRFRTVATAEMQAGGMPEEVVTGEVVEADPPHRLVQTWQAAWETEPATRLTYEITSGQGGVSVLTVTHDVTGAPNTAAMVAGQVEGAGGGWAEVLSGLKTLLETGASLYG
ncbi:SRPBCC domain-containing protein [Pseudonocardia sp. TRM90224]|uniref:SRPBCC domain-containing protein n=1 Tax=Pseudonocardia sp. TRM90224 TaxID=2812678 RepID=UPI001E647DD6|nr:SRPBCC domain-containing protein [Pseudonocardia sp. TRM90224]